jgi:hypothetical protein
MFKRSSGRVIFFEKKAFQFSKLSDNQNIEGGIPTKETLNRK